MPADYIEHVNKTKTLLLQRHNSFLKSEFYLSLFASLKSVSQKTTALELIVKQFLTDQTKVFLLQGSAGTGKTIFCHQFAVQLLESKESDVIPLYISLKPEHGTNKSLISTTLQELGFSDEQIIELKQSQKLVFILDGYELLGNFQNIYINYLLEQWQAKVIVTCRPEYFIHTTDYRCYFTPYAQKKPQPHLFREASIVPLADNQINTYLEKYAALATFQLYAEQLLFLKPLSQNPLFLKIIANILPKMCPSAHKDEKNEKDKKSERIVDKTLYPNVLKVILEEWFGYHEARLKNSGLWDKNDTTLKQQLWEFSIALAQEMKEQKITRVNYQPISRLFPTNSSRWLKFFNPDDSRLIFLCSGCPFLKVGVYQYEFIHEEILSYLASQESLKKISVTPEQKTQTHSIVLASLASKPSTKIPNYLLDHYLNQKLIIQDNELVQLLANRVGEIEQFKNQMFELVFASKQSEKMTIGAANAITILNAAKVAFSGMDLSGVKIPKADLGDALLKDTNFQEADLSDVNLQSSWMEQTNFSSAILRNIQLGEMANFIADDDNPILCMRFDPKGELLAIGGGRGLIHIWDYISGDRLHTIKATEGSEAEGRHWIGNQVKSICFSPNSQLLASGGGFVGDTDTAVRLWDVRTGTLLNMFHPHTDYVNCVCFSPDGNLLASGSRDKTIQIIDIKNSKIVSILKGHTEYVECVCFSPDGRFLLSGSSDHTIRVWDLSSNETVATFQGDPPGRVMSLAFSPKGNFLASTNENQILLWNWEPPNCKLLKIFSDKTVKSRDLVSAIYFSPDQRLLVSSSYTARVYIWDLEQEELSYKLTEESSFCTDVSFYPQINTNQEYIVAIGIMKGIVKLLRTDKKLKNKMLIEAGHVGSIERLSYHAGKKLLASGASDGVILWDMRSRSIFKTIMNKEIAFITSLSLSPDGKLLAIATGDGVASSGCYIYIWDIEKNNIKYQLTPERGRTSALVFNHKENILISGSWNGSISIWDLSDGILLDTIGEGLSRFGGCRSLCLNSQETLLAGGMGITAYIWDISDLSHIKQLHEFKEHKESIEGLSFNPDSTILASGSWDGTVCIWSTKTGKLLCTIKAHRNRVESVCFSPNGKWLFSGGFYEIHVWDMEKQKEVYSFIAHQSKVRDMRFIDDRYFVSGGWDHTIRLWKISTTEDKIQVSLQWTSHPVGLLATRVNISDATGLTHASRRLFRQYGAIDEDEEQDRSMRESVFSHLDRRNKPLEIERKDVTHRNIMVNQLPSFEIDNPYENVVSIAFSPDGQWIAASTATAVDVISSKDKLPGTVCLYNLVTRCITHVFKDGHSSSIYTLGFSGKGNLLASGGEDGRICVWDLMSKKLLRQFDNFSKQKESSLGNMVTGITFHPQEKWLVSASEDNGLVLWDIESKDAFPIQLKKTSHFHNQALFDPQGKYLVASDRNLIYVYNTKDFKNPFVIKAHAVDPVICMDFHPNGKWLATGHGNVNDNDKSILLWDLEQQKLIQKFSGPTRVVKSVAIHPSGKWLAAASLDNIIYLWDIENKIAIHTFRWNNLGIKDIKILFHPKENYLIALCDDNIIRRWGISDKYLLGKHEQKSEQKKSPLDSQFNKSAEQIKALIKKYNLVDSTIKSLEKGLRNAAANNEPDDLIIFMNHLTSLDTQDTNPASQKTALHWATKKRSTLCIKRLLENGAEFNIPDADGNTAYDYAMQSNEPEIIALFTSLIAITATAETERVQSVLSRSPR